ncbi:N-(5'-phosphoribosyl)anthranilate isomerase [Legionella gratiana]|uniref:N-(5'-phosphoribosyl)anthranilate isomerase n=2 Tax=Legionella gratiana TaxID=45066 RepID=A0A378J841_9GAMM|nr:N-(5'-phosphoribosyl)anthranilate isomerase [Legionella gratiana]STX43953.1 N-(5'-phosphoribosyl)anthranilate isomerase [Legionella gratiana]
MCGMTRSEDIACAVNLGVDAVGFIFYNKSARFVSIDQATVLLKDLPAFVDSVAVLVNPERDLVQKIIEELPIQLLQFHGDESAEFCQQFKKPFIKAIHPYSAEDIHQATREFAMAHALLLDTPSAVAKGGTGLVFDWKIIPQEVAKPYILAGGIDEFNVLQAIELCHPYAVDLCSGIEVSPGIKDHGKMGRFMQKLVNR